MKIKIELEIDTENYEDKKVIQEMVEYLQVLQNLHMPDDYEDE